MSKDLATVTDNWHVTIPKHIREVMCLEKGDKLQFMWKDMNIVIRKAKEKEDE